MQRVQKQGSESENAQRTAQAKFTSKSREAERESAIDNSPAMTAQRKKLNSLFGGAIQRVEDEEPLQGRFDAAQRVEEEEPLQGKFETAQRVEEEEPLQGKFDAVQLVEEEEPLQGKFEAVQRVEEEEPLQGKFEAASTVQLKEEAAKPNNTGLPDNLKSGIESLSGMAMDNVKVHYNSSQPAQLNALAYAQGTDIHVAPGQEQHLPHEAWHVVQQAQGRVKPTMQMKEGVPVNDDRSLEHEADVMGAKAISAGVMQGRSIESAPIVSPNEPAQLKENVFITDAARRHYGDGWGAAVGVTSDTELKSKVPDDAKGEQTRQIGYVYAPLNEQTRSPKSGIKKAKTVTLGTKDGKYAGETMAVHCGPVGPAIEHYTDTGKRCPWN